MSTISKCNILLTSMWSIEQDHRSQHKNIWSLCWTEWNGIDGEFKGRSNYIFVCSDYWNFNYSNAAKHLSNKMYYFIILLILSFSFSRFLHSGRSKPNKTCMCILIWGDSSCSRFSQQLLLVSINYIFITSSVINLQIKALSANVSSPVSLYTFEH